ncbi:MAG: hypothetical protein ACK55Z_19400 [bacterium]
MLLAGKGFFGGAFSYWLEMWRYGCRTGVSYWLPGLGQSACS